MIRLQQLLPEIIRTRLRPAPPPPLSRRAKLLWTLGNTLMLAGVVIMLYVGGLYANAEYQRNAARGDSDLPVPEAVVEAPLPVAQVLAPQEPAPFTAPILNTSRPQPDGGQLAGAVPPTTQPASVSRVVIPRIDVDSKVVEVGWEVTKQPDGSEVAVWQVAKFAVGQHRGSANPGEGSNIVLAGHVGGFGKVFKDLYYVMPGDQIILYSNGAQYLYTITDRLVVLEEGVSAEQHAANASYIAPTSQEVVTLVTCWPLSGPKKFSERVIVRAAPFHSSQASDQPGQSNWTIR